MMKSGLVTAALAALTAASTSAAPMAGHPFLDSLFSDNMVLQRGQSDAVWGWSNAGDAVTVTISSAKSGTKTAKAVAGANGKWVAKLPSLPVGGPYTLTVTGPGGLSETRSNILVGDVWICSGQSNMEFGVGNLANPEPEIAAADYPEIRLLAIDKKVALAPEDTAGGTWKVCTPDNLKTDGGWGGFSAVGYFFGRDLYKDLKIPIGLIHTSWGGTPAQAWTSAATLDAKVPDYHEQVAEVTEESKAAAAGSPEHMVERLTAWYKANDPGVAGNWANDTTQGGDWKSMSLPTTWEEAGIPELSKFDGIVWFRREVDLPADAAGKDLTLHFLADDNDATWVNGKLVGAMQSWITPRAYTIPAADLKPGKNTIVVRVLDTGGGGGIYGPADGLSLEVPGGANIPLTGAWDYRIAKPLAEMTHYPETVSNNQNAATVLYNGMIAPLVPYGVKGAIWYQGESNAGQAYQYRSLLPAMIGDWRRAWGQGDFPFLIVQLAAYNGPPANPGDSDWAELREAQYLTAKNDKNNGIAAAIDIGDAGDIHPKNKQEVGRRLSLVARKQVYHENVEASGPVYKSMKVEGSAVRISFDHADGGLVARGGDAVKAFQIAGADKVWHWANAKIDGNTVVVSSPDVTSPAAVRYAWASYIDTNLFNKESLPVFPFRTDDWPGVTVNNH